VAPERNSPCPCGSGKKYKKCCGAPRQRAEDKEASVERNRLSAYEGVRGAQRGDFCRSYTVQKKGRLAEIAESLDHTAREGGKIISCGPGCTFCCHVYVSATLPECDAIVYYLYRHEDALRNFLNNYQQWQRSEQRIDRSYKEIGRLRSRQLANLDNEAERAAFTAALNIYAGERIPCPFLSSGACTIYEVRPYVCAGLVATTPRERCRYGAPEDARPELIKSEVFLDRDTPYLDNPLAKTMISNLPALVYALLYRGWDFLNRVPGFGA